MEREPGCTQRLETLIRCRAAVSELIAGVRAADSPLARQVLEIYLFVFRTLSLAQQERSSARLQEVIAILEEERLTWQQLCEQLPEAPPPDPSRHARRKRSPLHARCQFSTATTTVPSAPPRLECLSDCHSTLDEPLVLLISGG